MASRTAGTITPKIGATSGVARSTNATFSEYIIAGADGTIKFTADVSGFLNYHFGEGCIASCIGGCIRV